MNRFASLPSFFVSTAMALIVGCGQPALAPDEKDTTDAGDENVIPATDAGIVTRDGGIRSNDSGVSRDDGGDTRGDTGGGDGGDQRDGGDPVWVSQPAIAPRLLATDGQYIFWTSAAAVHACPIGDTCAAPVALGTNEPLPTAIAVDGTNVYWTTTDNVGQGRGSIRYRTRTAGGDAPVTVTDDQQTPRCIAGGNGFVFWCTSQANQNRNIRRARLDGSQEVAIDSGSASVETMVLERVTSQIVWANTAGQQSRITVQFGPNTNRTNLDTAMASAPIFSIAYEGYVYFIESRGVAGSGRIVRRQFSPAEGPLEVVFNGEVVPKSLALSGTSLFFTTKAEGNTPSQLFGLDMTGTLPVANNGLSPRLRATTGEFEGVLAVNGFLYVADPANNRILRVLE